MMRHETPREPIRELSLEPQQPMLPFEQSAPAMGGDEPTGVEMEPREVWKALSQAMKMEVHRDCLRTKVQRRRVLPTQLIQEFQAQVQRRVLVLALDSGRPFTPPLLLRLLLRLPLLRSIPSRLVGFGIWQVHAKL
ncbi:MAG: hypothetical protein ACFB50_16775 [Rubrobacteraceae bacterium]